MSKSAANEIFERILAAERARRKQLRLNLVNGAVGLGEYERAVELLNC